MMEKVQGILAQTGGLSGFAGLQHDIQNMSRLIEALVVELRETRKELKRQNDRAENS